VTWTLTLQIGLLLSLVGAIVDTWIKSARQKLPPKGMKFVNAEKKENGGGTTEA
jgi:hypothetical protein